MFTSPPVCPKQTNETPNTCWLRMKKMEKKNKLFFCIPHTSANEKHLSFSLLLPRNPRSLAIYHDEAYNWYYLIIVNYFLLSALATLLVRYLFLNGSSKAEAAVVAAAATVAAIASVAYTPFVSWMAWRPFYTLVVFSCSSASSSSGWFTYIQEKISRF